MADAVLANLALRARVVLCGAIWVFAYSFSKLWRKWPAYAVCAPFFLVGLFFFFEEFSRLLPSNF